LVLQINPLQNACQPMVFRTIFIWQAIVKAALFPQGGFFLTLFEPLNYWENKMLVVCSKQQDQF